MTILHFNLFNLVDEPAFFSCRIRRHLYPSSFSAFRIFRPSYVADSGNYFWPFNIINLRLYFLVLLLCTLRVSLWSLRLASGSIGSLLGLYIIFIKVYGPVTKLVQGRCVSYINTRSDLIALVYCEMQSPRTTMSIKPMLSFTGKLDFR
jgi:hypothetical protein